MKKNSLFNDSNSATYCPEDDKIRLYVGRVPRDEFEALRAEGWTSTPKQECDFAAIWTSAREDTALSYAGTVDDEDMSPADRAADRADRFSGYLETNLERAEGHADRYDAGPSAHGFQSKARAVRSADRHDRIAGRAVNCWDKAEYWQSRTAGVIDHALHVSSPAVRMGRIKTLEAELRKAEKDWKQSTENAQARFDALQAVIDHAAGTREKVLVSEIADFRYELDKIREREETPEDAPASPEQLRRAVIASTLDGWRMNDFSKALAREAKDGTRPAAEIAQAWVDVNPRWEDWNPEDSRHVMHLKLRIAYEMQMLEAQGGRAALVEMVPGGFIGSMQIQKVNKSAATGRVVSVGVMVRTNGKNRWGNPDASEPEFRSECVNIERLAESSYRAPTAEELEAFQGAKKAAKAAAPKSTAPPLVNPTLEDAERLQAVINAHYESEWIRQHGQPSEWRKPKDPGEVCKVTQAEYSAASKGSYARAETKDLCAMGEIDTGHRQSSSSRARAARIGPVLCKVRMTGYEPPIVIHITDKPAKALPAAIWEAYAPAITPETLKPRAGELREAMQASRAYNATDAQEALIAQAVAAGLVNDDCRQAAYTDKGHEWAREVATA